MKNSMPQKQHSFSSTSTSAFEFGEEGDEHSMESRKRALTTRFLVLGMIGILMTSVLMSLGGYLRLQYNEMVTLSERVHQQLRATAKVVSSQPDLTTDKAYQSMATMMQSRVVRLQGFALFNAQSNMVINGGDYANLPSLFQSGDLSVSEPYKVYAPKIMSTQMLSSMATGNFSAVTLSSLVPLQGKRLNVMLNVDNTEGFARQRIVAMRLLLYLLLSTSLLFALLYFTFLRGIRTIDEQEQRLNQQISSLSNLLNINKSMQKSIRTASARAVELNEQFLRRTGADLHDGPAQMIGFSVMRLNQALDKDESGLIGPEFHAIKQALEESLEEIRGISSGLVLPELESMTLEQCMRKVVLLHTSAHKTDVGEFYQEIERDIPLPIKICAYRFVQEGLNNAYRHGQADQCRLAVSVKEDLLQISLKDNGIGFRKSQLVNNGKHLGLVGLKDRIESLGGKLMINSELGVGTALKLSVSLADDE